MLLFSKVSEIFFGYFDPENVFFDNDKKYFSGRPDRYFGAEKKRCFCYVTGNFPILKTHNFVLYYTHASGNETTLVVSLHVCSVAIWAEISLGPPWKLVTFIIKIYIFVGSEYPKINKVYFETNFTTCVASVLYCLALERVGGIRNRTTSTYTIAHQY